MLNTGGWSLRIQGKYHCAADLMFGCSGFDQTIKLVLINISKAAKYKQVKN